jgi:chromosomal replication initiator protein
VREVLEEIVANPLTVAEVAQATCDHFRLPLAPVRSPSRRQGLVQARQMAMYLARTLTAAPLMEIGGFFGGRDHSTVLYACRKTEELVETDLRTARAAREIRRALRESGAALPE